MKKIKCVSYFVNRPCYDRKNNQCSYPQPKNKNKKGNTAEAKQTCM